MNNYYLTKGKTHWELKKEGDKFPFIMEKTKEEALVKSREYVDKVGGSLHIQKEDGTFQEERTLGPVIDPPESEG